MSRPVELLILGDVCPVEGVRDLFDTGDGVSIFGGLAQRLQQADIGLCNLECVLSDNERGVEKIGPVLVGRPSDAQLLASVGIGLVGIANNHVGDCGDQGVRDTLVACHAAGLQTVGAGNNSIEAAQPAILDLKGVIVGVMAFAEREFNASTLQRPGAHIFNPLMDLERIAELKDQCDFVVVLYHGGIEHYPYPSPGLRDTCRSMVRHGADLVLCQHSHVIGAAESYQGGDILYGQGNSVYGHRQGHPAWNQGLAVSVKLSRAEPAHGVRVKREVEYLPIGCDIEGRVDLLDGEDARRCLSEFKRRSKRCLDEDWLEASWLAFAERLGNTHLPHVLGLGRIATRLNRLTGGLLVKLVYPRRQRLISLNVIRCDAHREVLETAFVRSCQTNKARAR